MSVIRDLEALNFHDTTLVSVQVHFGPGSDRSAIVDLIYYDWEGNNGRQLVQPEAPWQSKSLSIKFGFLAHFEFSGPDLVNRAQDIDFAEIGYGLAEFEAKYAEFKRQFPRGHYPIFKAGSEVVSLRLTTQNNDDESTGFLWVVGTEVGLSWGQPDAAHGQTHLRLRDA